MEKSNIQKSLYELWFKHYTSKLTGEQRSELVQEFIDDHLQGYDITTYTAKHPAHYHRESDVKFRLYPVAEILADFIIRAENDDSGLTASPQTQVNREFSINKHEELMDFIEETDEDKSARQEAGETSTAFTEGKIYQRRPDLYPDFTEEGEPEMTVDEFKSMIENVKAYAKEYAEMYADKYGKDYRDTLRRIKRLDIERVAVCEECGEVYYRHDMRRKYCDLRPSCEVNAKSRRDNKRNFDIKSEKVKDKAETLHYIIEGQVS